MATSKGRVYDLDFIQANDSCQALILPDGETINIVVETKDSRMQSILEAAMIMKESVEVTYNEGPPSVLTRAKLNTDSPQSQRR